MPCISFFKGSKARGLSFREATATMLAAWRPCLSERLVTPFAAHCEKSHGCSRVCSLMPLSRFKHTIRHALARTGRLQPLCSPRMCSPCVATGCVSIFAPQSPRVLSCHRENLHCATWRCRTCQGRPSRWHSRTPLPLVAPFSGEPLLIARNGILQSIIN